VEILQWRGEAHVEELADGPGSQPVTTRLLPRETLFFDDEDRMTGLSKPVRGRGARRSCPHHEHVNSVVGAVLGTGRL
jgi:hypothetical protein